MTSVISISRIHERPEYLQTIGLFFPKKKTGGILRQPDLKQDDI